MPSYRNQEDKRRQLKQKEDELDIATQNELAYANVIPKFFRNMELAIPSQPAQFKTYAEALVDGTFQSNMALDTLKKFMYDADANNTLLMLKQQNMLTQFNQFSGLFLKTIKLTGKISYETFQIYWNRFIDDIMANPQYAEAKVSEEEDIILPNETKKKIIFPENGEKLNNDNTKKISIANLREHYKDLLKNEKITTRIKKQDLISIINKKILIINRKIGSTVIDDVIQKLISGKGINSFKGKKIIFGGGIGDIVDKISEKTSESTVLDNTQHRIINPTSEIVNEYDNIKYSGKPSGKKGVKWSNFSPFGRYKISRNALQKNFLLIRYPSNIDLFPKVAISSILKKILLNIIIDSKFEETDYKALSQDEKELFDELITIAKLDATYARQFLNHKKITDLGNDKLLKDYKKLSGEILAGNNNPDLIKQLKVVMLALESKDLISKKEFNDIYRSIVLIL